MILVVTIIDRLRSISTSEAPIQSPISARRLQLIFGRGPRTVGPLLIAMSNEPKQLKDFSAEVKAAVPAIVEEAHKEVRGFESLSRVLLLLSLIMSHHFLSSGRATSRGH